MRRNRVPLTIALTSYDHVYEVTSGEVDLAGMDPTFVDLPEPPSFEEFADTADWDVSDLPVAQYVTRRLAGDDRIVALPIFTSRLFRHSCIHVREDRIRKPEDLRGARFGATDRGSTECVYARGLLADMYGIQPGEMSWVQGEPDELLRAGEIDAVIAPVRPAGDHVVPLFDRLSEAEREYFEKTRVFPIIRMVGVRRELLEQHRWLASSIYRAFEVARRRYFYRLEDIRASRVPIPAVTDHVETLHQVFGPDFWPYGVNPNRTALETFVRYATEQGLVTEADIDVADLFAFVQPFVDRM